MAIFRYIFLILWSDENREEKWKGLIYQGIDFSNRLEVSNLGRIRNVETKTIYKLNKNKKGYICVCISLGSRKNKKLFKVHRAVAETFIENTNNKPEINHIDGNKDNNKVENLEWNTRIENQQHAVRMGLINPVKGEQHPQAKLNNIVVKFIRENYKPRDKQYGCRALAKRYNVSHRIISDVINNKIWV